MPQIRIKAPAKLNLHLQIGDRRPDGFHDIESLFLALAFGDTLRVETVPQPLSFELYMDWRITPDSALPPEKNIVSRAVSLFRDHTGCEKGLKIALEKHIPLGGGLGGGSSDAAAALLALNRLASPAENGLLSGPELAEMGASLGSDVPFFLANSSAAWVSGRGEKIQPLVLPESARKLYFVLVNPGFSSDTAEAYRLLDAQGGARHHFEKGAWHLLAGALHQSPQKWPFFNDFLAVSDTYQRIISSLKEQGADFAGLSGSGSTCFGVFCGREKAESARESLFLHWPFVIISVVSSA